jgi:SAM-dependent methyltransferase
LDEAVRLRRAATFDQIAELYDRGRRECPVQVLDAVFAQSGVPPGQGQILEIGCGTGQATLPLARRGCRVLALEMGENLARISRTKLATYPCVVIEHTTFEDWQPGEAMFDIVLAITSWHWIDPHVRYEKSACVLRPGGFLAFTSDCHVFPPGFDPFFDEIQDCYEAIGCARLKCPPPEPDEIPDSREEMASSGLFQDVTVTRFLHVEEFTADEYVAMMRTASDHRLMEPVKRDWLYRQMHRLIARRPEGRVRKHNLTILHVGRKRR